MILTSDDSFMPDEIGHVVEINIAAMGVSEFQKGGDVRPLMGEPLGLALSKSSRTSTLTARSNLTRFTAAA